MKIVYGLKNGALLQRDENDVCKCFFKAEAQGELKTSFGGIIENEGGIYALTGIPLGGPYRFTLSDDKDVIELTDIYVGDLWLLGGQSNMEGAGKMRAPQLKYDENPVLSIRAYYMNESWGAAKSQLHQPWESIDECIASFYRNDRKNSAWNEEYPAVQNDGVGPGLYFALEMQKRMGGVPQGIIPCGIGGSNLTQWKPNDGENYYFAAKRRFHECGGNIRGIFWYQGESQCNEDGCKTFICDMQNLVKSFREDFENDKLPFVQVQVNKFRGAPKEYDKWYMQIREMQRTLDRYIANIATVYSVDSELDDLIHLSSESQVKIGKRGAEAMCCLTTGEGVPSPDFDCFEIVQDDYVPFRVNIKVNYKNIVGELKALGVPSGYYILEQEDGEPIREIARVCLEGNSIRLKVELDPKQIENYYVCYAYGNMHYSNITDGADRAIPGFGPFKIKDYLKK